MKILIEEIKPVYKDSSDLSGFSFLHTENKVKFTVISSVQIAEEFALNGAFVWVGDINMKEIEKTIIGIIKRIADDNS